MALYSPHQTHEGHTTATRATHEARKGVVWGGYVQS